ncbi:hypothetical protein [Endozoicomonas sp. SCSIO W0465]|uniref:hypothetical protein n=1 Tax=Endozoicomonas sp. SCSIO W0465 TaxID=2918516 RepID=UPI00207605CD|nr:hypothetical protein [Endozoicomonas sp. SCSIO W0465]USE37166.1 hypothetical protein MJO57_02745 [Endozoicomonas sp. SCSIO W0465]
MQINSTNSTPQLTTPQNEKVAGSEGKTSDNRHVVTTEANKQMPEPSGANAKLTTSLAERSVGQGSEIARPEDFQPGIDQREYFNSIKNRIDSNPAFSAADSKMVGVDTSLAKGTNVAVLSAFNSIVFAGGTEGATPSGARTHLENAFRMIKEMQSLDTRLNEFSSVDIALSRTIPKNREVLRPHVEAVFANEENKLQQ